MTQRVFSNEQYEVVTGWDRPLQMHYLDIYSRDPEGVTGDENGMIFSSRLMHNPLMLPEDIEGKLASYGIPIPATLRQDLYDDAAQGQTTHEADAPSRLLVTRVRGLAERVQGWFHSRDQDRGMDR
jgi:hypothetical protein